jgi:hypothetical protein
VAFALTSACAAVPHTTSGYVTRVPDGVYLTVYPTFVQPGTPIVVQTRSRGVTNHQQCVVVLGPDGLEHQRSCGADEARRVTVHPTAYGRYAVAVTYENDDEIKYEQGSAKWFCVLGGDDPNACDAP